MLNTFKSLKTQHSEREEVFIIGKNTFTIDKSESIIEIKDNEIIDLTIKTSEKEFERFSESDSFEFSWALYSPVFYARGLDLKRKKQLIINDENKYDYEVALYFMEHGDVKVNISLKDGCVLIAGFADVFGKEYPLEIFLRY